MKKKILLPILAFAVLLTAIAVIFSNIKSKNKEPETTLETTTTQEETTTEPPTKAYETDENYTRKIDFDSLKATNPDVIAWVYIPGTVIDYPILWKEYDIEYYLHHDINHKESYYSVYMDGYSNSDFSTLNNIIYGHHMKDGKMFTDITKFKNEDFFKELDKDRKEKNCEYAILVSLLEKDNDYYNGGIVDVSHKYEKMYVVRPQSFITIINILRNSALNTVETKRKLIEIQNQNIDIANFEEKMNNFKSAFSRNFKLASDKFDSAIDEIDKTMQHLQKIKDNLLGSKNQLRLANDKAEDLTIKKLTSNSPSIAKQIEDNK